VVETPVRSSSEEIRNRLVGACTTKRDVAIIELLHSGPRLGEVARLQLADVHLDDGYIAIAKSKSGRPRKSPIAEPRTQRALRDWIVVRLRRGDQRPELWITPDDRPMSYGGVVNVVRRITKRAGVEFSPHDGRRYFAETWLARGGSQSLLQAAAEWSSPRMVSRYVRANAETMAVDEARRILGGR
jgi:integrase